MSMALKYLQYANFAPSIVFLDPKLTKVKSFIKLTEINIFLNGDFRNRTTSENRCEVIVRFCRLKVGTLKNKTKGDISLESPVSLLALKKPGTSYT